MEILVYLGVGAVSGVLAGLLGIGGGLVIVPSLVVLFTASGFSEDVLLHMAIGTSLSTIVFTSMSSVRAHHRRGAVDWAVFRRLTPGILIGGLTGAAIADHLPAEALRIGFGIFALVVAVKMGWKLQASAHRDLPGRGGIGVAGMVIGNVASVAGIGGGTLTVPYLTWNSVSIRSAVATASACGLPVALAGAQGFIFTGLNETALPSMSLGYVYLPALLGIVPASVLCAPLGVRLAHYLPGPTLKRFFSIFVAFVGVRMLLG